MLNIIYAFIILVKKKTKQENLKRKTSNPVAHRNLTLDDYDLDEWEPTQTLFEMYEVQLLYWAKTQQRCERGHMLDMY